MVWVTSHQVFTRLRTLRVCPQPPTQMRSVLAYLIKILATTVDVVHGTKTWLSTPGGLLSKTPTLTQPRLSRTSLSTSIWLLRAPKESALWTWTLIMSGGQSRYSNTLILFLLKSGSLAPSAVISLLLGAATRRPGSRRPQLKLWSTLM